MTDDTKKELNERLREYLRDGTLDDFVAVIAAAVQKGIEETNCHGCPAPDPAKAHIGHFWGVIEDLGEGDYRRGIEQLRDISKFVPQVIAARNSIGNWVLKILVTSVTVGVLTAVWGLIKTK